MKAVSVLDLAKMMDGKAVDFEPTALVEGFATDSNQVRPGDLFLAIRGQRVDGHNFVSDAMKAGAVGAIVEQPVKVPHILVPNLVEALAKMALTYRKQFKGPVIGITGSAGKTTTKEFVACALSPLGRVLKTIGNRNTEYTAPLLWPEVEPDHKAAVVEMSMRGFGQIAHLAKFSLPTMGIVTNIGYSHLSKVGTREGIAEAKGELLEALPKDGVAILWEEDPYLEQLAAKAKCPVKTFGITTKADCSVYSYRATSWKSCRIDGHIGDHAWQAEIPVVGRHIALNAAAAVLTAHCAGIKPSVAAAHLRDVKLPPMRMEVHDYHGATVVLDNYNASPPSVIAAIETLADLPCKGRRLMVLGEMRELGDYTAEAHRKVGYVLAKYGIDEVICYEAGTQYARDEAMLCGMKDTAVSLANDLEDIASFLRTVEEGDTVLIKGSRSLELEKALDMLGDFTS